MLNYCIMCFGLHVCAITCKTLCRWLLLSCMFFFFDEDIGCSSGFCVLTMCCMSIILGCVFPSDSHFELIKAVLHTSVFKAVRFFFVLSQVFHYFFQMIIVIKGFMANGRSVVHYKIIQYGHFAAKEENQTGLFKLGYKNMFSGVSMSVEYYSASKSRKSPLIPKLLAHITI